MKNHAFFIELFAKPLAAFETAYVDSTFINSFQWLKFRVDDGLEIRANNAGTKRGSNTQRSKIRCVLRQMRPRFLQPCLVYNQRFALLL